MSELAGGNGREFGAQSMVAPLRRVLVRRPAWSPEAVATEADWRVWGYASPPELERAAEEHDRFTEILRAAGAELVYADEPHPALYDSIFTYDIAIVTDHGAIILNSGKPVRREEGAIIERALAGAGVPILGRMTPPATADGGDTLWLDHDHLLVGRSYRTNRQGINQLRQFLEPIGVTVLTAPVVHWTGPGEVMHLMSVISPVDDDLAVVYSRLMAVETMEILRDFDIGLIEVPDDEFPTLGPNVLAVAPRRCVIMEGNPKTRRALEAKGAVVFEYPGREVSIKMGGGPTCMTKPILRQ
ncbi:MAG TPA: arginine deiminase family protein [Bacillota bacterium]